MIDFHAHTFPDRIAEVAVKKLEEKAHATSFSDGTREGLLRAMRAAGIDHAVVLPVAMNPLKCASMNDTSYALDGRDGLTYFAAIHPDAPDWHEELGRAKELGFRGVKIHPVYQDVAIDDVRFVRILSRCGELGLTVVMHGGADIGFPGVVKCSPAMLLDTCVYLDTAYSLGEISPLDDHYAPEELPMLEDARFVELVRIFGSERVLFGTDSPWDDPAQCIARISALPLTDAEKADIFDRNARRLLAM